MTINDPKIAMANAALVALDYIKNKKLSDTDEIIKHVMKVSDASKSTKLPALAAANEAIKLRRKNPELSDKQIMQMMMNNFQSILDQVSD